MVLNKSSDNKFFNTIEYKSIEATALNHQAVIYSFQRKHTVAESLFQKSLEIREQTFGKNNLQVARSLNNLAGLYFFQRKYADAEPLLQRSLKIREDNLEKDHPDIAESLNNLAGLYLSQGKYNEVKLLLKRSLAILEKTLCKDHLITKNVRAYYENNANSIK